MNWNYVHFMSEKRLNHGQLGQRI